MRAKASVRIPITMCHGIDHVGYPPQIPHPLPADRLTELMKIAHDMGFESISYDDLEAWRNSDSDLPDRPIMIDFDHPVRSMRHDVLSILNRFGFTGNLFIYTRPYDRTYERPLNQTPMPEHMTWKEIRELVAAGWFIGAHTVTHPNLSDLSVSDASGEIVRRELDRCNEVIEENLGIIPRDFAYTGTSWSSLAETEVKKRYRFGRLWIVGSHYLVDGKKVRYAELAGASGEDEEDGGPPVATRYIDRDSNPYRLPSMDLQALINSPDAFRRYLEGALRDESTVTTGR